MKPPSLAKSFRTRHSVSSQLPTTLPGQCCNCGFIARVMLGTTCSVAWTSRQRAKPMIVKKLFALGALTIPGMPCASQPLEDALQPSAVKVAQQRGASELECPAATTEVLSKHAIEEPQTNGWYEFPRRAEYTIAVSGCGKRTTYLVACNKFKSACKAGSVPTQTASPRQLADELLP